MALAPPDEDNPVPFDPEEGREVAAEPTGTQGEMSADLFANAVAGLDPDGPNYLGDPEAVEGLFRVAISNFVDRWMHAADDAARVPAANQADMAEVERMATILMGRDKDWLPIADFNARTLPVAVKTYTGMEADSPEELMQGWLAGLFNYLHDDLQNIGMGQLSLEDAANHIEALIEEYTLISTGQTPHVAES